MVPSSGRGSGGLPSALGERRPPRKAAWQTSKSNAERALARLQRSRAQSFNQTSFGAGDQNEAAHPFVGLFNGWAGSASRSLVPRTDIDRHRWLERSKAPRALFRPEDHKRPMSLQVERPRSWLLWVDAVGGFRIYMKNPLVIGQTGSLPRPDIELLADVRSRHALIARDSEGYVVDAVGPVSIDGRAVEHRALLPQRCMVSFGRVRLKFVQPHPLSLSARLDWTDGPRTTPSVDALLLMADHVLLGPSRDCHVVCSDWCDSVILFRRGVRLYCTAPGDWTVNGRRLPPDTPLPDDARIRGERFSFALEPE